WHQRFALVDHCGCSRLWTAHHGGSSNALETVIAQPRNPARLAAGHSGLLFFKFFERGVTGWIERRFGSCRRLPSYRRTQVVVTAGSGEIGRASCRERVERRGG